MKKNDYTDIYFFKTENEILNGKKGLTLTNENQFENVNLFLNTILIKNVYNL